MIGKCTYADPLEEDADVSFKDALVFNNKLYCPHHGCAFDVTSGLVEYGPAYDNLSKFFVE